MTKICVVGLWHLGLVSAAVLADLGHEVTGFDSNADLIQQIQSGKLPLYEPGLDDLIQKKSQVGPLRFEAQMDKALANASVVLITYDTPVNDQDEIDLSILEKTLDAMIPKLAPKTLVVVHSQIPVGTSKRWQKKIDANRPKDEIDLVYSPENLRLGNATQLYKQPDMLVIGAASDRARQKATDFFKVFQTEKLFVSHETAEMAKHALNIFFATSISFANEIGNLCDAIGADGMEIAKILKLDSRIGKKAQVRPGLGFAGATLARDLKAVQNLGKRHQIPTILADSVYEINRRQINSLVEKVRHWFAGQLRGKTFAILGLTYKPGTSTLRRSASLEIMEHFHQKGVALRTHDPKADLKEFRGQPYFEHFSDPYETVKGADALLLLTEWPQYRDLDFEKIFKLMNGSKMILDAKNHLDGARLKKIGFQYLEIGRGQFQSEGPSCYEWGL